MRKYDPLVFAAFVSLCSLGYVSLGIASSLPQYQTVNQVSSAIGGTLLIAGWKGFLTLNGGSIGAACLMASVFCLAQCT
jgi:hypothetical protein